ncbi:hypothetical protein ACPEIF_07725 [Streptomyces sp. NPDC012600]|uniref:Transmembrane protein n=1 Tax=Streptomyces stephensoniae TaxID=3375367 RepID=A0ABU2WAA2_9ACTN|nr:hypothetical protein [Streptomyces griseus]MDT0494808.1 hypothetical protein [Streptomyces griseus]
MESGEQQGQHGEYGEQQGQRGQHGGRGGHGQDGSAGRDGSRGQSGERGGQGRRGRPERWQDRWWAIALLVLVAWVGIRLVFDGWSGWPGILVGGFLYAGFMTWFLMRRRRRDARAVGTDAARVPELERRIAKNGELPEDPAERAVMVRLIRRREEKLRRNQWWAFPLLGLVFFGLPIFWFAAGNVPMGVWGLVFGALLLGWMVWFNRRFVRRMARMRQRIEGVGGGSAGASAAGPVGGGAQGFAHGAR